MAALAEIRSVAEAAAKQALEPTDVVDVSVEAGVGFEGDELIRVRVVVSDAQFGHIDGDHFLHTLLTIQRDVRAVGDDRLIIVSYATPSELADDGDTES